MARLWRALRRWLPPLNFITIHYLYFIGTCLLSAIIFWGSSTPARSVSFTDSLFLTVSAMSLAGLNTVNLSTLNTFQQFLLFLLIMLGSAIFVSAFVVHVRRHYFERKFKDVIEKERERVRRSRGRSTSRRRRTFSLHRVSTRNLAEGSTPEDANEKKDGSSEGTGEDDISKIADDVHAPDLKNASPERDLTPPARRGAPEMNGISSQTGDRVDNAVASDDEEPEPEPLQSPSRSGYGNIKFSEDTRFRPTSASAAAPRQRRKPSFLSMQGVGARPNAASFSRTTSLSIEPAVSRARSEHEAPDARHDISKFFTATGGWISRNSQFHGLTEKERERLGGHEYRAVVLLSWLVPAYFILWQLLGCLGCAAWVAYNRPATARENGLNPWWVGAFNAVSAFNNSGMSLLDANMTAFQTSYYMLITMSLLILAGNTCYPVFLRLIVWTMLRITERFEGDVWKERAATLEFLLIHPRRCYTNLFPSQHTWWLLLSVVTLNGVDWAAFEILNIGNMQIEVLPTNIRVIDGLFQAFAVRSGGFYVVSIPSVRISLQVLYVVMMYISVYPVVITMRNSNVYEERSLGIYADDEEEAAAAAPKPRPTDAGVLRRARTFASALVPGADPERESNSHFVRHQLRAQLAHDAWIIVLALFLIMIIESSSFNSDPRVFSVFNFIFEIVSGYGCVGISTGVPWDAYSFCGAWKTLSKLILCLVMMRGRHRGLPVAIDKAVLLPGDREMEGWGEEEDGRIRLSRRESRGQGEA